MRLISGKREGTERCKEVRLTDTAFDEARDRVRNGLNEGERSSLNGVKANGVAEMKEVEASGLLR